MNCSMEDLATEYQRLMKVKLTQRDKAEEIQPVLEAVVRIAKLRDLNIYGELNRRDLEKQGKQAVPELQEVEMIETPDSSAIHSYGYNELLKTLFVKYKSGDTTYPIINVEPKEFEDLQEADSKGRAIASIRKKQR